MLLFPGLLKREKDITLEFFTLLLEKVKGGMEGRNRSFELVLYNEGL